jgi:hypothetical protein
MISTFRRLTITTTRIHEQKTRSKPSHEYFNIDPNPSA